jgi:hypothetical protein
MKKALLIGINYLQTSNKLFGCINDVNNMNTYLTGRYPTCLIQTLTDAGATKPTKANIMTALTWLRTGVSSGDKIYLHYSGHGSTVRDTNNDETDGYDEAIVSSSNEVILDDYINTNFIRNIPSGVSLYCVFDSCCAGTVLDLPYNVRYTQAKNTFTNFSGSRVLKTIPSNVYCICGSLDLNYAYDVYAPNVFTPLLTQPQGALTYILLKLLYTRQNTFQFRDLVKYLQQGLTSAGYPQIPTISSNVPTNFLRSITI